MQFIKTNDGNMIIHTSKGLRNIPKGHFNYLRINRVFENMVKNDEIDENKILELLEVPDLKNGLYKAYVIDNEIIFLYTKGFDKPKIIGIDGKFRLIRGVNDVASKSTHEQEINLPRLNRKVDKLLGYYKSIKETVMEWPEYV